MVCTSSFDGHVSVFSLMGGSASGQDFHQQKVSAFTLLQHSSSEAVTSKNHHIAISFNITFLWQYFVKSRLAIKHIIYFYIQEVINTVLWNRFFMSTCCFFVAGDECV